MLTKIDFKANNFDLLRILAAFQVVLVHSYWRLDIQTPTWWPLLEAFPGVSIFFVISGYLISGSFERNTNLATYARNRIIRIFPALWCCILITVIVFSMLGASFWHRSTLAWLPMQLLGAIYTPAFLKEFGFGSYNGSLWTIPIELQFYILLPILYYSTRRISNRNLATLIIWALFFAIAASTSKIFPLRPAALESETLFEKLFRYSFVPHFYLFLTGVLLQRVRAHELRIIAGKGAYWIVAYIVLWYLLPFGGPWRVLLLLVLAVACISLAYTLPQLSRRVLKGNDLSYGVYIYHGLFLNVFVELQLTGRLYFIGPLVTLTFIAAGISWMFLERPLLKRKTASFDSAPNATAVR